MNDSLQQLSKHLLAEELLPVNVFDGVVARFHEVLCLKVGQRSYLGSRGVLDLVVEDLLLDRKLLQVLDCVARAHLVQGFL